MGHSGLYRGGGTYPERGVGLSKALSKPAGKLQVYYHENDGDIVTMRWLAECCNSANSVEQVITAWLAFAFQYTQSEQQPLSVHFTMLHWLNLNSTRLFRCPVYFESEFNEVKIKVVH